jgi:hypothetical protein
MCRHSSFFYESLVRQIFPDISVMAISKFPNFEITITVYNYVVCKHNAHVSILGFVSCVYVNLSLSCK